MSWEHVIPHRDCSGRGCDACEARGWVELYDGPMVDEDPLPAQYRIHVMPTYVIADNGLTEAGGQDIGWIWVQEFSSYKSAVRGCWAHLHES